MKLLLKLSQRRFIMTSRKMFVVFLCTVAIAWVLAAGYVLAQPPGDEPAGGPPLNPPIQDNDIFAKPDGPGPGPGAPGAAAGSQNRRPGGPAGAPTLPKMRRSVGVAVGPDGQVREIRSEGGVTVFGASTGTGGGGGFGGAYGRHGSRNGPRNGLWRRRNDDGTRGPDETYGSDGSPHRSRNACLA